MEIDADAAWRTYNRITAVQTAMVFDGVAQFIGHTVTPEETSPTMYAIIERGRSLSGVEHSNDIEQQRLHSRAIASDLAAYDVFLAPTLTHPPRPFGFWDMSEPDIDAYNAKWTDAVYLYLFNISGQPAMSVPMHWTAEGLPVGVQLVGRPTDEATLDRLVDVVLLCGVLAWYAGEGDRATAAVAAVALATAVLTSYAKARAETRIPVLEGGLLERGERIGLLAAGALFDVLAPVLWLLAAGGVVTVAQRFAVAYRALGDLDATRRGASPDGPQREARSGGASAPARS